MTSSVKRMPASCTSTGLLLTARSDAARSSALLRTSSNFCLHTRQSLTLLKRAPQPHWMNSHCAERAGTNRTAAELKHGATALCTVFQVSVLRPVITVCVSPLPHNRSRAQ